MWFKVHAQDTEISPAMHYGSDAAACALEVRGGGGLRTGLQCYWLVLFKIPICHVTVYRGI